MNERIWELAKKAGINLTPAQFSGVLEDEVDEFTLEDFAKLLIRECVEVMYDNAIERKVPPDINQVPTYYAIAVLEHFGVDR